MDSALLICPLLLHAPPRNTSKTLACAINTNSVTRMKQALSASKNSACPTDKGADRLLVISRSLHFGSSGIAIMLPAIVLQR